MSKSRTPPLAPPSVIIKLLYSNFTQIIFGDHCYDLFSGISLKYLVNGERINRRHFPDIVNRFYLNFVNKIFYRIEYAYL